jgi:hypothetical protein
LIERFQPTLGHRTAAARVTVQTSYSKSSAEFFMVISWLRTPAFYTVILGFATPTFAVTYTASVLHPAGYDRSYGEGTAGAHQIGSAFNSATLETHAILWSGTAASAANLTPPSFISSTATGASLTNQVGFGSTVLFGPIHALLWSGTAASAVDLHPAGYDVSLAAEVSGPSQVGWASGSTTNGLPQAALWSGSAASFVNLHPAGLTSSAANDVSGATQVGEGAVPTTGDKPRALLWSGNADSVVHLNPVGFTQSAALGVFGGTQVGSGAGPATNDITHALLWNSTAASAVDLHPSGFFESRANDISPAGQVGVGAGVPTNFHRHALLWKGTAQSALDLHPFVSALNPSFVHSSAQAISEEGVIVGIAYDASETPHAVFWTPVPESGLPGDYNNDGTVDTADYVFWRKHEGTNYPLPNEVSGVTPNQVTEGDYYAWRAWFGSTSGSAAPVGAIPEPSTCVLLFAGLVPFTFRSRAAIASSRSERD